MPAHEHWHSRQEGEIGPWPAGTLANANANANGGCQHEWGPTRAGVYARACAREPLRLSGDRPEVWQGTGSPLVVTVGDIRAASGEREDHPSLDCFQSR